MTTTEPQTSRELLQALLDDPDLLDMFRSAVRSRAERPFFNQAGERVGINPLATTGRVVVSPGQTISSASWGNPVWDQSVNCFDSATARDAQWPTPHDGSVCFTADTQTVWLRKAGVWVLLGGGGPALLAPGAPLQSLTDASGQVWVAKGGVNGGAWKLARDVLHARVSRGTALTITGSQTVIAYDTATRDPYGMLAGGAVVVPVPGLYLAHNVHGASLTPGMTFQNQMMRNGAVSTAASAGNPTGATSNVFFYPHNVDTYQCAAGDQIGGSAYLLSGASVALVVVNTVSFLTVDYLGTG